MTFFYDNAINVYTDASVTTKFGQYVSAPGFLLYKGKDLCEVKKMVLQDCSNTFGELYAVKLALEFGTSFCYNGDKKSPPLPMNIFSDSLVAVNSVREWIAKWVNNSKDRILLNKQNTPVKNQEVLLDIMNTILFFNTNINIYHVNSHLRDNNPKDIYIFKENFKKYNNIELKDFNLIRHMIRCNNHIDEVTRLHLRRVTDSDNYDPNSHILRYPLSWFPTEKDLAEYVELINKA